MFISLLEDCSFGSLSEKVNKLDLDQFDCKNDDLLLLTRITMIQQ
jgi:hypothetical protein